MKTLTIIAAHISDEALAAALPARGVGSITVTGMDYRRESVEDHRGFHAPGRFAPSYRVEVIVDDDAVDAVFDGISFAYGAGLFSDAEVWVNAPGLALSA